MIAGLVVCNGLFAMSELAIVSARPARLRLLADDGVRGAAVALRLASAPGRLLSTAQIGLTLVGVVAGAFSAARLGGPLGERLATFGLSQPVAGEAGVALAIVLTTLLSLVVGELVPKHLALRDPELIARHAAPVMDVLARLAGPLVWLLDRSSMLLLRAFGLRPGTASEVTAEEIELMFDEATASGVIEAEERALLSSVMRLAERPVRDVMTPRTELEWIDRDASAADLRGAIAASPHSLLLVAEGSVDRIVGVVKVREVLAQLLEQGEAVLASLMRKPAIVPDQLDTMEALRAIQQAEAALALVHDEYGHLEGIVTPADLLAAIAGQFVAHGDEGDEPMIVRRDDGSLLVAGALPADALADTLAIELPEDRDYATAAGFVLSVLKKLPDTGERFTSQGWQFEVVDMDGRKIDKLLIAPLQAAEPVPAVLAARA